MIFPRRFRRGLIEADELGGAIDESGYGFPRRFRRGLIEARDADDWRAQAIDFRGDSAAASLKRNMWHQKRSVVTYFRGDSAAASLKLGADGIARNARRISAAIPPRPH